MPEELFVTNITTEPPRMTAHPPSGFVEPTLDGEVTSYFEWVGAGQLELESAVGSMHRVAPTRQSLVTGYPVRLRDRASLRPGRLRRRAQDVLADKGEIRLSFFKPANHRLSPSPRKARMGARSSCGSAGASGDWQAESHCAAVGRGAATHILEVGVPWPIWASGLAIR